MEKLDQYAFYDLAKTLHDLVLPDDGDVPLSKAFLPLFHAQGALYHLDKGAPFQLGLSRTPCRELKSVIDNLMSDHFEEIVDGQQRLRFPDKKDPPIPSWRWMSVTSALQKFEMVLREELREAATYYVPRRGIYFTPALVDAADEGFPADIRSEIPTKTLEDWRSAGRCLAFNLLSAAGFHVARAVEGTIEAYYQFASGQRDAILVSWYEYIKELEKLIQKNKLLPSEKMIAEIRQMKDDYRNPIMHPRVVLTESDARMLFNNGESLIIGMAQEITTAKKQNPAALVALVAPNSASP